MSKFTSLFLHMGPGLHGKIENEIFGKSASQVCFWDQELATGEDRAFSALVQSTSTKISRLAQESGAPIKLLAHSFGGLIASQALLDRHKQVSECHFFSTGFDYPGSFINLMEKQASDEKLPSELQESITAFLKANKKLNPANFMEAVGLLTADETFMARYWHSPEDFQAYAALAAQHPPMDFELFVKVSLDVLTQWDGLSQVHSFKGPVTIHFGKSDPLIKIAEETKLWKEIFPQSDIQIHSDCGHFCHIENKELFLQALGQ